MIASALQSFLDLMKEPMASYAKLIATDALGQCCNRLWAVSDNKSISRDRKDFIEDVIAKQHANDGIKKAVRDPKSVRRATDMVVSFEKLTWPNANFFASEIRKNIKDITVENTRNEAHWQILPSLVLRAITFLTTTRSKNPDQNIDENGKCKWRTGESDSQKWLEKCR